MKTIDKDCTQENVPANGEFVTDLSWGAVINEIGCCIIHQGHDMT